MYAYRLSILLILSLLAQGASAATIWLKDKGGNVCTNTSSANPGQVVGYGGVNRDGTGFTLTIDNPAAGAPTTGECKDLPRTDQDSGGTQITNAPIVFSGTLTSYIEAINAVKAGTNGNPECLDQGMNFSGVSGAVNESVVSPATPRYNISFTFSYTDGCTRGPPPNLLPGQPDFLRQVSIATVGGIFGGTVYSGDYHLYNDANPIPEPGSLALIFVGILVLFWIFRSQRERKRVRIQRCS